LNDAVDIISVDYPKIVAPGEKFSPRIVVIPRAPYQLREDRGDFLAVVSEDGSQLFGIHPHISVTGNVEPGQPYIFLDQNMPIVAPQLTGNDKEKTYSVKYRVWMHTRYTGPIITINFTVRAL
jgi:hypothetical protein